MTVSELIDALSALDPDAVVFVEQCDGTTFYGEARRVVASEIDGPVFVIEAA